MYKREVAALQARLTATQALEALRTKPCTPEQLTVVRAKIERHQEAIRKWQLQPDDAYTRNKIKKAQARLAPLERKLVKQDAVGQVQERDALIKELRKLERLQARIEKAKEKEKMALAIRAQANYTGINGYAISKRTGLPTKVSKAVLEALV